MNCLNCQKETDNPKFCSRSCAAITNNKLKKIGNTGHGKIRICEVCNTNYKTSLNYPYRKRCPDCKKPSQYDIKASAMNKTLGKIRAQPHLKKAHRSSLHAVVRQYCRSWNKKIRIKCQVCNYLLHVELCHIKDIALFPDSATLGEVNHPNNILVLCRNHHWEFDNGYLLIDDIPKRD